MFIARHNGQLMASATRPQCLLPGTMALCLSRVAYCCDVSFVWGMCFFITVLHDVIKYFLEFLPCAIRVICLEIQLKLFIVICGDVFLYRIHICTVELIYTFSWFLLTSLTFQCPSCLSPHDHLVRSAACANRSVYRLHPAAATL